MNKLTDIAKIMSKELTEDEAIELAESGWWKDVDLKEAANIQLRQERLCMDFSDFHQGLEKLLGRPVWTHEFASRELLISEADGKRVAPRSPIDSFVEIAGENAKSRLIVLEVGQS